MGSYKDAKVSKMTKLSIIDEPSTKKNYTDILPKIIDKFVASSFQHDMSFIFLIILPNLGKG